MICIQSSTEPDRPAANFNEWAEFIHNQLRQYEPNQNEAK